MILIGDHTLAPVGDPKCTIYNLTSFVEGFERLDILPGKDFILTEENDHMFDIQYANFLLSQRMPEIMKMMCRVYNGLTVYLMVYHDNGYFDMMLESIIKFIQSRYGIIPIMVNTIEDYETMVVTQYNMSLSMSGLYNYDIDNLNYTKARVACGLNNFGMEIMCGEGVDENGKPIPIPIGQLF